MPQKIRLYGVIGDEWAGLDAEGVAKKLDEFDDGQPLEVRINSAGGLVSEGLPIYQMIAAWPGGAMVYVDGLAGSMASLIAMAGKKIMIADGGFFMIHDPSNITIGTAEEHRKAAAVLDKMGTQFAGIYAKRTGNKPAAIAQMMADETWMTAEEAVALGFADEITGDAAETDMRSLKFDHLKLQHAPDWARSEGRARGATATTAAKPALAEEVTMAVKNDTKSAGEDTVDTKPTMKADAPPVVDVEAIRAEAAKAERARMTAIRAHAAKLRLTDEQINSVISSGASVEAAAVQMIDMVAEADIARGPQGNHMPRVDVLSDSRDRFMAGAANWLMIRSGAAQQIKLAEKLDPGEFRGMTLMEMARHSLELSGVNTRGMDRQKLALEALQYRMNINQGVGDFAVLLENVMHKTMLGAYELQPMTWNRFCRTGSVSDFRSHHRYRLGSIANLTTVGEFQEVPFKPIPDGEKQSIAITTQGIRVAVSRQMLVNDDMSAFNEIPTQLGQSAARSVEAVPYALLALNAGLGPTMSDGNPLYHARTPTNIGTGAAYSMASIDLDRQVMASQLDPSGLDYLDLRPDVVLVPLSLGGTARELNANEYDPSTASGRRFNDVRGLFSDVIDTPRLTGTRRYMFANPSIAAAIEVAFLEGQTSPMLEAMPGWSTLGQEWRMVFDFGGAALDYRATVTNAGTT